MADSAVTVDINTQSQTWLRNKSRVASISVEAPWKKQCGLRAVIAGGQCLRGGRNGRSRNITSRTLEVYLNVLKGDQKPAPCLSDHDSQPEGQSARLDVG